MNKITLLFRSKKRKEHSVENMFQNIEPFLQDEFEIEKKYLPEDKYFSLFKFLKNVIFSLRIKSDLIHVTGENYFCAIFTPREKTVLTILDYVALDKMTGVSKFLDWLLMYYVPIKRSRYVTCISDKIYEDTIRRFPWCKPKTQVVLVSISDMYQYSAREFRKDKPTILVVGSTPNKNLNRIINALNGIICKLDIVGHLSEEQIQLLERCSVEYEQSHNISNEEVLLHYKNCDIVCFPSTYEGFGMPIVEGQAIGRPVVTSNIEPMSSIAGGAACLVDPFSTESIHQGIIKVVLDDLYRGKLIKNGLQNCKKYSNDTISKEYIDIYNKILEK